MLNNDKSDNKIPKKKTIKFGRSTIKVNEDELSRAGIKSYHVQVQCCSNGRWKILYEKDTDIVIHKP